MKTEVTKADEYIANSSGKRLPDGDQPFFNRAGEHHMVHCVHADDFTALTDQQDDKHYGVIAMARHGTGMFCAFTPDELRSMATRFAAMADYIEKNDG